MFQTHELPNSIFPTGTRTGKDAIAGWLLSKKMLPDGKTNSIHHWGIKRHRLRDDTISTTHDVFWLNAALYETPARHEYQGIF
jgi:hypothetical protein